MKPPKAEQAVDLQGFRREHALRASVYLYSPAFQGVVNSLLELLPGTAIWYVSEDGERIEFVNPAVTRGPDGIYLSPHVCRHTHQVLEDLARMTGPEDELVTAQCEQGRSVLAIPVRLRNLPAGYLGMCGPEGLSPETLRAAAEILRSHVDLLVTLLAEHDDIELVQHVWQMMTSSMNLEDLLSVALGEVLSSLGLSRGAVILFNDDGQGTVRKIRGSENGEEKDDSFSFTFSEYRRIFDPENAGIQEAPADCSLYEWARISLEFDPAKETLCVIPFRRSGTVLGFALAPGRSGLAEDYQKRLVLRTLLSGVSALIYGLVNIEEIRDRRYAQRTLHALFRSAGFWESKDDLLRMACELTARAIHADKAGIMLLDESGDYLEPAARLGLESGEIGTSKIHVGEGVPGYVVEFGEPVRLGPDEDPLTLRIPPAAYPDQYYISFPLAREEVFGVITLSTSAHPFESADRDLLKSLSEALSVLVENALLREKQRRLNLDILQRLINTLETGDPGKGGRTYHRTSLALKIGKELDLAIDVLDGIEYASLLADTGLGRSGKPLESTGFIPAPQLELSLRIAECMRPSQKVMSILRHLTENYDGSGNPDGLSGKRIPYGARIIACAGAFAGKVDKGTVWWEALEDIKIHSGTLFDPKVIGVLEKVASEEYS